MATNLQFVLRPINRRVRIRPNFSSGQSKWSNTNVTSHDVMMKKMYQRKWIVNVRQAMYVVIKYIPIHVNCHRMIPTVPQRPRRRRPGGPQRLAAPPAVTVDLETRDSELSPHAPRAVGPGTGNNFTESDAMQSEYFGHLPGTNRPRLRGGPSHGHGPCQARTREHGSTS